MRKHFITLIFALIASTTYGQNPMAVFDNLMGKTWKAEGKWENDGPKFVQEITFEYSLDSTLVQTKTKGYIDKEQTQVGQRNYGIRQYDGKSKSIKFWEFDIFGGLTEGTVSKSGKDILYQYRYGESELTDMWEYVNDSTYNFKVGTYQNKTWEQLYLKTWFRAQSEKSIDSIYSTIKKKLVGNWTSKAWDGILNENWYLDDKGDLGQGAKYFEEDKLLYEATNKIQLINNDLILITVVKNGNPKIFQATSFSKNELVFENKEYKNPNKVIYRFTPDKLFEREIRGTEDHKPSTYTFKFKKVKE